MLTVSGANRSPAGGFYADFHKTAAAAAAAAASRPQFGGKIKSEGVAGDLLLGKARLSLNFQPNNLQTKHKALKRGSERFSLTPNRVHFLLSLRSGKPVSPFLLWAKSKSSVGSNTLGRARVLLFILIWPGKNIRAEC